MKTKSIFCMALLTVAMLCAAGCTKPNNGGNEGGGDNAGTGGGTPNPNGGGAGCPKVETVAVTDITSNSAKSGGIITDNGDGRILEQGICWSTSGTPVVDNTHATATVGETSFTCAMNNLSPSTTYYVCAYAINTAGVGYGDVHNFKTASNNGGGGGNNSNLPVVTTTEVNHIKHTSARCGGSVTADGGSTVTARGICWSRHEGTTLDDNVVRIGSGMGEFSVLLQDLNPTTTYYVRAYATNSTGTNYGEEFSFVTKETPEPNPPAPTGAIDGLFSVSPTKQVWFSQGNLQYQASTGIWRFATNSYDYVGGKHLAGEGHTYYGNVGGSNNNISSSYSGWIDLFGWGTSGWNNGNHYYHPYDWQDWTNNTGQSDAMVGLGYGPTDGMNYDYNLTDAYAQADWGVHNSISNGGNQIGLWRTLTIDEWIYLFEERSASTVNGVDDARFAAATIKVGSKNFAGVILFPDDYTHPEGVPVPKAVNMTTALGWNQNTYTTANWMALQAAGCVFLPPGGLRNAPVVYNGKIDFDPMPIEYWSTTSCLSYYNGTFYGYSAVTIKFSHSWDSSGNFTGGYKGRTDRSRSWGFAVRLVQDRQ